MLASEISDSGLREFTNLTEETVKEEFHDGEWNLGPDWIGPQPLAYLCEYWQGLIPISLTVEEQQEAQRELDQASKERRQECRANGYSWAWAAVGVGVVAVVGGTLYGMSEPTPIEDPTLLDRTWHQMGYPLPTEPTMIDKVIEVGQSILKSILPY